MRHIRLSDPNGNCLPDAYYRVLVTSIFPESETDRELALKIVSHEKEQLLNLGRNDYRISEIAETTLSRYAKLAGQQTVCGLVALVMTLRGEAQHSTALHGSAQMVRRYLKHNPMLFEISKNNSVDVEEKAIPKSLDGIKDAFKRYKSVAHILAARIVCSEYIETLPLFDSAPIAELSFVKTAIFYQKKLADTDHLKNGEWNVWDMVETIPNEIVGIPILTPSIDVVSALFGPNDEYLK